MTIAMILQGRDDEIVQIPPTYTVRGVAALLTERRIGAVPVMDGDQVVGIISERDIVRSIAGDGHAALDWPVERVMTRTPITVGRDTTLLEGLSLMTRRRIRHLPVIEDGKMVGFVSIGDLVKARIDTIESEAEAMRTYIST
jgi:CBS domain-containing protein